MVSANPDPELREWLRWDSESGRTPCFVRIVAEAGNLPSQFRRVLEAPIYACASECALLCPVLVELNPIAVVGANSHSAGGVSHPVLRF